ncbi:hypothetical protein E0494_02310 [Marinilabiliaceae bacterium JC040]|nr:hypothetical protein [Marinilabiliaceae bacterium JC040]
MKKLLKLLAIISIVFLGFSSNAQSTQPVTKGSIHKYESDVDLSKGYTVQWIIEGAVEGTDYTIYSNQDGTGTPLTYTDINQTTNNVKVIYLRWLTGATSTAATVKTRIFSSSNCSDETLNVKSIAVTINQNQFNVNMVPTLNGHEIGSTNIGTDDPGDCADYNDGGATERDKFNQTLLFTLTASNGTYGTGAKANWTAVIRYKVGDDGAWVTTKATSLTTPESDPELDGSAAQGSTITFTFNRVVLPGTTPYKITVEIVSAKDGYGTEMLAEDKDAGFVHQNVVTINPLPAQTQLTTD